MGHGGVWWWAKVWMYDAPDPQDFRLEDNERQTIKMESEEQAGGEAFGT